MADENTNENNEQSHGQIVIPRLIQDEMKQSYLDYSMSVIVGRALPDVRDGLKPVHRRVIYSMWEMGLLHNKPFKKCARVVGDCLGKYHPHGDTAVFDALVRLAQNFSMRYPLIEGQGNFGCFTSDTKVKLVDGRDLSFLELINEHNQGKRNFTFSIDEKGLIKIAEIKYPRLTRKNVEIIKIFLDNGEEVKCTLNHKFMLIDGSYKEAKDLISGNSLMPSYFKLSTEDDDQNIKGYSMIFQPTLSLWSFVHILSDEWNINNCIYSKSAGRIRHHLDFNKLNNHPNNFWDNKRRKSNLTGKKKFLKICNHLIKNNITLNKENYEKIRKEVFGIKSFTTWDLGIKKYYNDNKNLILCEISGNHKVVKIEFLNEFADVYDLTIDSYHNFALAAGVFVHNSVDGDPPAAMRYVECRLTKLAEEMLQDIDKRTVKLLPNFDNSIQEPSIFPAKLPNLLVNGSSGIAVGMATNIPPHNLREVANAVIQQIENRDISINELLQSITGPDFPTGGIICGKAGIIEAYHTGRGKLIVRAKTSIESKSTRNSIIVSEIPYMVNKSELLEEIASLIRDKKIVGISDLRDESDREGMRIVIELKKDADENVVINQLFQHSRLQVTFGVIMLALVNNVPKVLNLKQIIQDYISHRKEVIRKRALFDLNKAQERSHVLEGILIAIQSIDKVIKIVRGSKSVETARDSLIENFRLTREQAVAILEMRLQRLTSLEHEKVKEEQQSLLKLIDELEFILSDPKRISEIVKKELEELRDKYGDNRKTEIAEELVADAVTEDMIKKEDMVVTITHSGYIKRLPLDTYKVQHRGGKGIVATAIKEEDIVSDVFIANTHSYILFFTNKGKVYWLKVYNIPEATRISRGKAIVNLLQLEEGEKISASISVNEFDGSHYLLMATKHGIAKKTELTAYSNPRRTGIIAITLDKNDELVNVRLTDGQQQIILATKNGLAVRFEESKVRPTGRSAQGVKGISLKGSDEVIGMVVASPNETLLTVTENGYGKRTPIDEYRLINRGGSGVINIQCTERNSKVVSICSITGTDDIMFISKNGIMIRVPASDISVIGRNTQGVRIMKVESDDKVVGAVKVQKEKND